MLFAFLMLAMATRLSGLVHAVWLGAVVEPMLGVRAAVHLLTAALTRDLAVLVVGALVVFAAARRDLGRAFDLACVAVVPLVVLDLAALLVTRALDVSGSSAAMGALFAFGLAWTGGVFALAIPEARRKSRAIAAHTRAGWILVGVAAAAVSYQITWIATHVDDLRPLVRGGRAPVLALPRIGPGGALGERVTPPPGQVTIVDFWATWCNPCLAALPGLDTFARGHPEVAVIAVDLDDPGEARALFDAKGYTPTLVEDDRDTSERFGVISIPHTVVIGADGMVRRIHRGTAIDLDSAWAEARRGQ